MSNPLCTARRLLVAALFCAALPAAAQDFPTRPITVINSFAAGGNADIVVRLVGQRLESGLGQPLVIENRPGGNTAIGSDMVAI
jgi:tripartite-type tricarboxylate transporter receptor subunit TctC